MALDPASLRDAVRIAQGGETKMTPEARALCDERSMLRKEAFEIDSSKGLGDDTSTLAEGDIARLKDIEKRLADIKLRLIELGVENETKTLEETFKNNN